MTAMKKRMLLVCMAVLMSLCRVQAQDGFSKDGATTFHIGCGYAKIADAYTSSGFSMGVEARFYTTERLFADFYGQWGNSEGSKEVMQKGSPFSIRDERNSLLGVIGVGYDVVQSEDKRFCAYVRTLAGYGMMHSKYDDYQPLTEDDGVITRMRDRRDKGFAAVCGVGFDARFKGWLLTPSFDMIYVGNRWNMAAMLSVGFFCSFSY